MTKAAENGLENNVQIKSEAPILHVIKVLLDPLLNRGVATAKAVYLRQSRDATLHTNAPRIRRESICLRRTQTQRQETLSSFLEAKPGKS